MEKRYIIIILILVVLVVAFISTRQTQQGLDQDQFSYQEQAQPQSSVKLFLIALEDNGQSGEKIGCNDSVIPVDVEISPTTNPLQSALENLLTVKSQYYGESGLYNSLYQSDLALDSVTLTGGKATVNLSGTLQSAGVCDDPRIVAQLEKTSLQFPEVQSVEIFVNGKSLEQLTSGKGE